MKKDGESKFETKISKFLDPVNIPGNISIKMQKEIEKHRLIRISLKDNIMLFLYKIFPEKCCKHICKFKNHNKLQKLF